MPFTEGAFYFLHVDQPATAPLAVHSSTALGRASLSFIIGLPAPGAPRNKRVIILVPPSSPFQVPSVRVSSYPRRNAGDWAQILITTGDDILM